MGTRMESIVREKCEGFDDRIDGGWDRDKGGIDS